MSYLMERHQLGEMLLTGLIQSGPLLRHRRQKRIRRKIEQARPALSECPGDLRNAQMVEREGTVVAFIEVHRGRNFLAKLPQEGSRARQRFRHFHSPRAGWPGSNGRQPSKRRERGSVSLHAIHQGLFEIMIGIQVERETLLLHGLQSVVSEVEPRHGNGVFRAPAPEAHVPVFPFFGLYSRGHKPQPPRPAEGQIKLRKRVGAAHMRVPASAGAHEKNAVARIADHRAFVGQTQTDLFSAPPRAEAPARNHFRARRSHLPRGIRSGKNPARGRQNLPPTARAETGRSRAGRCVHRRAGSATSPRSFPEVRDPEGWLFPPNTSPPGMRRSTESPRRGRSRRATPKRHKTIAPPQRAAVLQSFPPDGGGPPGYRSFRQYFPEAPRKNRAGGLPKANRRGCAPNATGSSEQEWHSIPPQRRSPRRAGFLPRAIARATLPPCCP